MAPWQTAIVYNDPFPLLSQLFAKEQPTVKAATCSQHLKVGLIASVIGFTATPMPSFGQVLEEVIVTARQREESLQDVPVTVTAFTQTDIERQGIERAEDFIALTPGVSMVDSAEVGDTQVNIRGINGARDAENSFALIIDGILQTNPAAFNREYADLAQIEILKGPQGAIYGRNAAAGAIIITTQRPDNEFDASIKLSAAEDSTFYYLGERRRPLGGRQIVLAPQRELASERWVLHQ